jgi:hypothetical protein
LRQFENQESLVEIQQMTIDPIQNIPDAHKVTLTLQNIVK